ncbi:MAG TPA: condensation domain-containing protein, partial [Longimicrobiaceae bacterium]|nr:condensation domain-containing protein [Longimicrobiaceae bacterium]
MSELSERLAALSPAKRALLDTARARPAPIQPLGTDTAPLSFEQRRLWFVHRLAPGTAAYTIPFAYRLRGALDTAALERAQAELVRRHAALRTTFADGPGGEAVQRVRPDAGFALERLDLRALPAAEREAKCRRAGAAFVRRPFDLAHGPLFRVLLVALDEQEHVLAQAVHHLVADGASQRILLEELGALYAGAPLPAPPAQLADFAAWQRRHLTDAALAAEADYWRRELAAAPHALEVPPDRPRPAAPSLAGAKEPLQVPADVADALRALARAEGTSLFTVLLAAFAALLQRCTGEEAFLVGTAAEGRTRPEIERAVGFFANTLPLRARVEGDPDARALVRRLHRAVRGAHDHPRLPFDRMVELAGVRRDPARAPLVQVMFLLNEAAAPALRLPGVAAEQVLVDAGASAFDLALGMEERAEGLYGELQYATELYLPATAARLARRYEAALAAFARHPDVPLSRLPLVGGDERRQALAWGRGAPAPAAASTLHGLFAAQA